MIALEHLDVNIVTHCNKTCVSCSHASPYSKPFYMKLDDMIRDLDDLKNVAHFELVTLVGGEPLLHPQLVAFMHAAKASGICDKVCVVTNGSLLPRMKEEFWSALEVLRLSIYGSIKPNILPLAQERAEVHGFELLAWEYPEFYKQLKLRPDDGVESFRKCEWKTNCFTVHLGSFYLCPQSIFFPPRFMHSVPQDGLLLEGITEEKLEAFLNRTEPFEACKICLAGEKAAAPWREAPKRDWEKLSRGEST